MAVQPVISGFEKMRQEDWEFKVSIDYTVILRSPSLKSTKSGAEEMTQQLRALVALPEVPGSVPSIHMAAHKCYPNFRGSNILTQTYMQAKHQCT